MSAAVCMMSSLTVLTKRSLLLQLFRLPLSLEKLFMGSETAGGAMTKFTERSATIQDFAVVQSQVQDRVVFNGTVRGL